MKSKFIPITVAAALSVALTAGASTAQTQLPTFGKAFSPSTIGPGSTSTLTFTITNPSSSPVAGLSFTDVLPAGMTIASPASVVSNCRGNLSATGGGTTISLAEGSLGGNSSCTISVNVTASSPGNYLNTSGDLVSAAGNSGGAEAELIVDASRPGFSKSFSPEVVRFGGKSRLTFTIDNSLNASGAFNPTFTDKLPLGMVVANPANVFTDCTNTIVTAVPGGDTISLAPDFSLSLIAAGEVCTLSVDVVAGASGPLRNTSGDLSTSPSAGGASRSSGTATGLLTATTDPIVLTSSFLNDPVGPGASVDLEFAIFNLSRDAADDISFSSDLDAVLPGGGLLATGLPLSVCGGTLSTPDGGASIVFSGGALTGSNGLNDGANSCSFSVTLQVPPDADFGEFVSSTSAITAEVNGANISGAAASDSLFIVPTLTLTKSFTDDPVAAGGTVTLEYTLVNDNPSAATGISFSDELTTFLPATLTVDRPADGFCGAGSSMNLVSPGTDRLSVLVSGAEVPADSSCTFSITLGVPTDVGNGSYPSTTSAVTGTVDGAAASGVPASDSLVVVGLPSLSKSFVQNPVLAGATTTLQFTIALDENAPTAATNLGFTDALGAALAGLVTTPGLSVADVCGAGSVLMDSSTSGDGSEISLAGGTLQPGESCTFSLEVFVPEDADSGSYTNTTSGLLATVGGLNLIGAPASAVLNVANIVLTKEFIDDPVIAGGDVTLRFTLTNNGSVAATSISFEDDLGVVLAGLSATGLPLSDVCGDGSALVGSAGNSLLALEGGSLDPGESCSFDVTLNVPAGTASDSYVNATNDFEAVIDGAVVDLPNASDTLVVSSELLQLTKSFTDDPVNPGGTVTLEFTLANIGSSDVTDISFTDDLGAALPGLVATGLPASDVCGPGSSLSGTSVLTLSGGSLAAGTDCTFSVTLQVPANLTQAITATNTTSAVSGTVGNLAVSGTPASDKLNIDSPVSNAPAVTINQAAGQADPTNASPINFTVQFNQPVSGFTSGDVSLSSGSGSVTEIAPLDGTTYNVAVSGMAEGVLTATVPAGVARNASSVGNNASTSTDNQVKYDTTPPVITLNGSAIVTLECGVDSYTEQGATAVDACDGTVPVTVGGGTVNTSLPGTYGVTYEAVDSAGNTAQAIRFVTVADATAPVITLNGPASVTLECNIDGYSEQGATAADACDPNVSVTIGGDVVDAALPGSYTVTYDAVDSAGNAADQVSRTVQVVDTIAPVLTLVGDETVIVIRNETYTEAGADIAEACDQNAAVVIGGDAVDTSVIGAYLVTYDATDASGNSAIQLTRTVKVIPRFATIVGLVGNEKVMVDKDSTIDGSIGARLNVDIKLNTEVYGSITSVEGKVNLKENADVGGDIDAGDKVELDKDSSLAGSISAGDDVKLKQDSFVGGDVTSAGDVDQHAGATVVGTVTPNAAVPPLPALPLPMLDISAGGDDVDVAKNAILSLPPGSYGKLEVKDGGTLILTSGAYVFEEIKVGKEALLDLNLPITIDVEEQLEFAEGVEMDANGSAAEELLIQVQGNKCDLKKNGSYVGTFLAPSADIKLEHNSALTGALVGKEVEVKRGCTVTGEIALDLLIAAAADWVELAVPLRLVSDGAPDYYDWAEAHGVVGAPDDDDDLDGINNEFEHLLDLPPRQVDSLPVPSMTPSENGKLRDVSDAQVSWSFPVRSDLETMPFLTEVEVSTDLRTWVPCSEAGFSQSIEDGFLSVSGPFGGSKLFMRLGVRTELR